MNQNKLSHTAAYIAVKFYGLTLNPKLERLFEQDLISFYRDLVSFLPKHLSWYHGALKYPFWRRLFVASEELLLPGDLMHIICRKYFMTRYVDEAISQGYDQMVILGAGFDHLGKYASDRKLDAFELDTPFMMDQKRQFMSNYGYASPYWHSCPLDVRSQDIEEVLNKNEAFDPLKKTIVIGEGFFDYLSLSNTEEVLQSLGTLLPNHRLISTMFSLNELNFFYRSSFTSGVAMVGEALKLPLDKEGFENLLSSHYYKIGDQMSHQEMERKLIHPSGLSLPVLKGFYILNADYREG